MKYDKMKVTINKGGSFVKQKEEVIKVPHNEELMLLVGNHNKHLLFLEDNHDIEIHQRGCDIHLLGNEEDVIAVSHVLCALQVLIRRGMKITLADVVTALKMERQGKIDQFTALYDEVIFRDAKGQGIRIKTLGQKQYIEAMKKRDIVFGIGPAGTGKTFISVVMAVKALKQGEVKRIIVTRPAVEAGENLGFLPGDLQEKIDPYLRPIYDALYTVMGKEQTERLMERGVIEIAPLAYMRGRTLEDAFVILDEAQNTTTAQMKMFLTRLGYHSKMIINGDKTQIDLPRGVKSGLLDAENKLRHVSDISFITFNENDVVRHPLVAKIIDAYKESSHE